VRRKSERVESAKVKEWNGESVERAAGLADVHHRGHREHGGGDGFGSKRVKSSGEKEWNSRGGDGFGWKRDSSLRVLRSE
jgi:hypothetical protein